MRRYFELDLLRTVAIVLMVVYHFAFDLAFSYGWPIPVLTGGWLILQRITANLFLLLVGIGAAISHDRMQSTHRTRAEQWKHTGKRAAAIFGAALLVTGGTYVMDPATYVRFGILHLIGTAALLLPLSAPLREGSILLGILLFLASDAVRGIARGYFLVAFRHILVPQFPWIPQRHSPRCRSSGWKRGTGNRMCL
jgi:uncharacterized membrane protein